MVFAEDRRSGISADVVQVDISKVAYRPDPDIGMEIPVAIELAQPDIDGICGDDGVGVLKGKMQKWKVKSEKAKVKSDELWVLRGSRFENLKIGKFENLKILEMHLKRCNERM